MHNVYGTQMQRATHEGLAEIAPQRRPFVITRAAYAGAQRFGVGWTGDNSATWDHLKLAVQTCLSLGVSGMPFTGADVGGFVGAPTGELLARWTQLGAVTPLFRNHSAVDTPRQEPWLFGDEVERVCKRSDRVALPAPAVPLHRAVAGGDGIGLPILRPLPLVHPDDETVRQTSPLGFYVGDDILAHPVLEEGPGRARGLLPRERRRLVRPRDGRALRGAPDGLDPDAARPAAAVRPGRLGRSPGARPLSTPAAPVDRLEVHVYPAPGRSTSWLYDDAGDGHDAGWTCRLDLEDDGAAVRLDADRDGRLAAGVGRLGRRGPRAQRRAGGRHGADGQPVTGRLGRPRRPVRRGRRRVGRNLALGRHRRAAAGRWGIVRASARRPSPAACGTPPASLAALLTASDPPGRPSAPDRPRHAPPPRFSPSPPRSWPAPPLIGCSGPGVPVGQRVPDAAARAGRCSTRPRSTSWSSATGAGTGSSTRPRWPKTMGRVGEEGPEPVHDLDRRQLLPRRRDESTEDSKWDRSYEFVYTAPSLQSTVVRRARQPRLAGQRAGSNRLQHRRATAGTCRPSTTPRTLAINDSTDVLFVFLDTTPLASAAGRGAPLQRHRRLGRRRPTGVAGPRRCPSRTPTWKVVAGHHPIYVGSIRYTDNERLVERLVPLFERYGVQMYLAGHDHNLQHHRPPGSAVDYFVSGAGSLTREVIETPNTLFALRTPGLHGALDDADGRRGPGHRRGRGRRSTAPRSRSAAASASRSRSGWAAPASNARLAEAGRQRGGGPAG